GDRAARDADEPAGPAQHGAVRRSRGDDSAGHAGVLPAAEDDRRPGGVHRRQDSQRARVRAGFVPRVERAVSVSTSKEPAKIAGMFDLIAKRYDALNHLLSAGMDKRWRRRAIRELKLTGQERVLDVCTGTGDFAIEAMTSSSGRARDVVGV